jgi:aryl-alcohol dehydrogenase
MKIRAAVVRDPSGTFTIEDLDVEDPRDDEVLVRVAAVGMCHTDLAMRHGRVPQPAVLGHEGAGVVERVGARVTKVHAGDHVVVTFLSCGHCSTCQRGLPSYCENGIACNFAAARLDGSNGLRRGSEVIHGHFFGQSSFATHALASERNVVKVRKDVPLELLGALGCGLTTGAGAVLNSVDSRFRQSIAVFGAGAVGLGAIMAARLAGYTTVIAVDVKPNRLAVARELGASHTIDASTTDPVAEVRRITGRGADYTIEASGRPDVLAQAVDCLALLGVCGVIGGAPPGTKVTLDVTRILFGRAVRGILGGDSIPDVFIPKLVELYVSGRFPLDRLITYYPLDQINQAAADSLSGVAIKPVLRPG